MLRFNEERKKESDGFTTVSIHPMLRFNLEYIWNDWRTYRVSIHPMLRFNVNWFWRCGCKILRFHTSYVTVQLKQVRRESEELLGFPYILCYGSTKKMSDLSLKMTGFPYILCYGSTIHILSIFFAKICFHTSYVTVQHLYFRNKLLKRKVSIHPMLRFNLSMNVKIY